MKIKYLLPLLIIFNLHASEMKCGKLDLMFVEDPTKPGEEFKVEGCYNPNTYFMVSKDCRKNPTKCLSVKSKTPINHPGGEFGSPAFVQCYKNGGKPRFLKLKVGNNWEDTSTCFFGSREHFMDYDTLMANVKK